MTIKFGLLLPGYCPVGDGINAAVRGMVRTNEGDVVAICKVLDGRGLAVELVCAELGCCIGLPVPQAMVAVSEDRALWFASEDEGHPSVRHYLSPHAEQDFKRRLLAWPKLSHAGCFDEWIANPDRHGGNILHDGGTGFWLIDHDHALPAGAMPGQPLANLLFQYAVPSTDELGMRRLKKTVFAILQEWREGHGEWLDNLKLDAFQNANELVNFLKERHEHLPSLVNRHLQRDQHEIFT